MGLFLDNLYSPKKLGLLVAKRCISAQVFQMRSPILHIFDTPLILPTKYQPNLFILLYQLAENPASVTSIGLQLSGKVSFNYC